MVEHSESALKHFPLITLGSGWMFDSDWLQGVIQPVELTVYHSKEMCEIMYLIQIYN